MTPWWYNNNPVEEVPEGAFGFTYRITINQKVYYGMKQFHSHTNVKKGKKELAAQDGRASKKKKVVKEGNWKTYCSSSDVVKELVLAGHTPVRQILTICYCSKELRFRENKLIYAHIEDANNLNGKVEKFWIKEINTWNK